MSKQFKIIIKSSPVRKYSESFKRQVVAEFENGGVTKDALQLKHGISGNACIVNWCRKFGKLYHSGLDKGKHGRPLMDPSQRRIKELEAALKKETEQRKEAELKVVAYEKLIEIAERDHGVKLKKDGAKQSAS
jgi:transposase-like protein